MTLKMSFAKYYEVTDTVNKMIEDNKIYAYEKGLYKSVFVCLDVNDFWISRVQENMNEDYEYEEGKYIIERNRIPKEDILYHSMRVRGELKEEQPEPFISRKERDTLIGYLPISSIVRDVIILDDMEGLTQWDYIECDSYEEVLRVIDNGFGIDYSLQESV